MSTILFNNSVITNALLVLNSLDLIADGIHTLDNRCLILPFDYAGQELVGDNYGEGGYARENYTREDYNENGYGFAN